jgi:hypothetical protein
LFCNTSKKANYLRREKIARRDAERDGNLLADNAIIVKATKDRVNQMRSNGGCYDRREDILTSNHECQFFKPHSQSQISCAVKKVKIERSYV